MVQQQPRQLQMTALVSSSSIPVVQHRLPVLPQWNTVPNYIAETETLKQTAILVKDSLDTMLPNNLPHWCIIGVRTSPNKQVSSPSNTNARTLQHMQSSSPMNPSTMRNPWQRASRSASQMHSTRRATINQHPLQGKDHHHQNSAEIQTGEGCIPPYWQARPGGFGTTAFRPQQAERTYVQQTKNRSFPNVSL